MPAALLTEQWHTAMLYDAWRVPHPSQPYREGWGTEPRHGHMPGCLQVGPPPLTNSRQEWGTRKGA